MKPTYKIFIVDDDDFDSLDKDLPYMTKEKLKDSIGFANPKTNEAYIRKTGVSEIDDSTLIHEVMELIAKTSPDEVDGIRYKKGGALRTIVPAVLSFIPGVGPALAAVAATGMDQYAKSRHPEQLGKPGKPLDIITTAGLTYAGGKLGQSTPGFKAGVEASKGAGGGLLGQSLSGAKGMLLGTPAGINAPETAGLIGKRGSLLGLGTVPATPTTTPAMSLVGGGVGNVFGEPLSVKGSNLLGASKALSGTISPSEPVMSLVGGGTGNIWGRPLTETVRPSQEAISSLIRPSTINPASADSSSIIKGISNQTLLGVGALGASLLPSTPQYQAPTQVADLQQKISQNESLTPLGQQAKSELSNILKAKPTELYPTANDEYVQATLRRTREQYAQAEKELDASYNLAGVYGTGEHLAAKAKLKEELARTESAIVSEINERRFELARTAQYQAIQDALKVDRDTMDDIVGLTGMSVQAAAMAYGAKVEDVKQIRESLGTLGIELILKGMNKNEVGVI